MKRLCYFAVLSLLLLACRKEEEIVVADNTIPYYGEIPTILVENYVNRMFIDVIGREPTDLEMQAEVAALENAALSAAARIALAQRLMQDETPGSNGESYQDAYYRKLYNDQKARFLDGISEASLMESYNIWRSIAYQDSLEGNMLGYEIFMLEANKVKAVMDSREELQEGTITIDQMCWRMMFNSDYDQINMNTFNFINATFDDCFARFPTEVELDLAFEPIESNQAGLLFGEVISSKPEYLDVLVASDEFDEGMVRWCYRSLLAREGSTAEVMNLLPVFTNGYATPLVQQAILITDEYAGFD